MIGAEYQNRNTRRIPIVCPLKLRVPDTHQTFEGITRRLSVDDITFDSEYVPRYGQLLEVTVTPPPGSAFPPLKALIQVFSCVAGEEKGWYEIAGQIKKVLQ